MNDNGTDATILMPEGASTIATHVDALYYDIFWISLVSFVLIVGTMAYFALRFRRQTGVRSRPPGRHTGLQLLWVFGPLILLGYMFHQGFDTYMTMAIAPETSVNIRVRARSNFVWEFEHPNGAVETATVQVPVHQPVRMIMSSVGTTAQPPVLHSLLVPAFRVQRDIVPGMYTSLWFEATREGDQTLYCGEYCGIGHSTMRADLHVVSGEAYAAFLSGGAPCPDQYQEDWAWGEALFASNGCGACHNAEAGAPDTVGPNLANVFGTNQPLEDGTERMADAEYIASSLTDPAADIVRGFTSAAMPAFSSLSQRETRALTAYLGHISEGQEISSVECGAAAGEQ